MKGKFGILLAGGFVVLSAIAAATGNFATRLELATQQSAQSRLAEADPAGRAIDIPRISLAQGAAAGFGQFQPRSNVIAPGSPFNIYFEATNLTTRFANGNVTASMSVDILVRNLQGQTMASRDNLWQLPLERPAPGPAPLTNVYGDLTVNQLPFPEGRYQILLRIHDDFNGTFADRVIDIEIRSAAVAPAPRLSQSQPVAQVAQQAPRR